MPTRSEMQSLSDRMQNNHADFFSHTFFNLDGTVYQPAIFNNFYAYQYYWTSSTDAADGTKAWTVFSCDFGVYDTFKESVGYTLAVRGVPQANQAAREPGLVTRRGAWQRGLEGVDGKTRLRRQ